MHVDVDAFSNMLIALAHVANSSCQRIALWPVHL
jgi:hypothetical protein